jgi:uncharacterized protein
VSASDPSSRHASSPGAPVPTPRPALRIAVFAKAPRPGTVKTRLIPAIGAEGAALLHRRLAVAQIERAREAFPGCVELWCAPDRDDAFFASCESELGVPLRDQTGDDLGERMHRALADALERADAVLLVGTDCPGLTVGYLREAARRLDGGDDAVLGPVEDGGYAMIGLRVARPELFRGMRWSHAGVAEQTRVRLRALGMRWSEMPVAWDVDTAQDLERLARHEGATSPEAVRR